MKQNLEKVSVTGVVADENKIFIEIQLMRPRLISILDELVKKHRFLIFDMTVKENAIWFFAHQERVAEWRSSLNYLLQQGFLKNFVIDTETNVVSVVGFRFFEDLSIYMKALSILEDLTDIKCSWVDANAITFGINRAFLSKAVKELHHQFLEKDL